MARRFANYEWAIKHSGGSVGGELKKYLDFKTGNTKLTRAATAAPGDSSKKGLTPFSIEIDAGALHEVTIVTRQTNRANFLGLTVAELGLENSAGTHVKHSIRPATIQGAKSVAATDPETSQITGVKYKKRTGDAFSIPFGKKTATDLMGARFLALVQIAKTADGSCSISYTPERILR